MGPTSVVKENPERFLIEPAQVGHHSRQDMNNTFLVECTNEVVVVDDVGIFLRPKDDRHHVFAEKRGAGLLVFLPPALALSLDFAQTDGNLCWPQIGDSNRVQHGCSNVAHRSSPLRASRRTRSAHSEALDGLRDRPVAKSGHVRWPFRHELFPDNPNPKRGTA